MALDWSTVASVRQCEKPVSYAKWPCVLDWDHKGDHVDFLGRTCAPEDYAWKPVIDPKSITYTHAERVLDMSSGREDTGKITVEGVELRYWTDSETEIWFYGPDDEPEDENDHTLLARFAIERSVYRL